VRADLHARKGDVAQLQQQLQDALATADALHSEKRELRGRLAEGDEELQRLEATVSVCIKLQLADSVR
jgi:predicted nuclease with TOPRIM domain